MKEFFVYHTFDIDQDFDPLSNDYYNRNQAHFTGFTEGIPEIIERLGGKLFSVFLRADYQIQQIYGAYGYLIHSHPSIIHQIVNSGGEINWHIHLYEKLNGVWGHIKAKESLYHRFKEDFTHVRSIPEINSNIVRIGECLMDNGLMACMNDLGITIDSTALPLRKRDDAEKRFDWSLTGNSLYHPSKIDYRKGGIEQYHLLEVPMTTIKMQASYDDEPYYRYVNLSFKSDVLFQSMQAYILNNDLVVTMTHPFEVLPKGTHPLISFDMETFHYNLTELDRLIRECGKIPVYKKISELLA